MYKVTSIEDQQKFVVPLNSMSEKLFYNLRMLIDTKVDVASGSEPRAWHITKINRISPSGLARITLAQDRFDTHRDYIEYEDAKDPSTIIGMWADYWSDNIKPVDPEDIPSPTLHSIITFSGVKPEIKVGGSYKKFTVKFYDDEDSEHQVEALDGTWGFTVRNADDTADIDASDLIQFEDITPTGEKMFKQIKAKFIGNDEWISKNMKVWYTSDSGIKSHVIINIVGL